MTEQEAIESARAYFLRDDTYYGCAETSPAMALNGGVAWSGGVCGAVTGAALAVGRLAAQRIPDHKEAKRTAREIIAHLMDGFRQEYGALDCQRLTGVDISTEKGHAAFLTDRLWQSTCMHQIEFVVRWLLPLRDEQTWQQARGVPAAR